MVKFRMRTKIMAVVTFLVMSAAVILGGYDMQNAEAAGGTNYVKYTFATGQTQTYNLPEIPTINRTNSLAMPLSDDPRDDADRTPVVVKVLANDTAAKIHTYGTGFIIGDHEIMTAAHCVYNVEEGKFYTSSQVEISLSESYSSSSIRTLSVVSVHFPKKFKELIDSNPTTKFNFEKIKNDYAIITVNEDLSEYGKLTLGTLTSEAKNNDIPIHVLGYCSATEFKISHGSISDTNDDDVFATDAFTTNGTSGGPMYVECVFGIPGTSNEEYKTKSYKIVVSLDSAGGHGPKFDSEIFQFAYDNEYL